MKKYSFKNDYSEGAHPQILEALLSSNATQEDGYGEDSHSRTAIELIRKQLCDPAAAVHLISGGTQTNLIAISAFLRPHEACICAATGHIATHETGAVEATGHKLLTIASRDGKLAAEHIQPMLDEHHFEHMVKPRLVYISNPTELGTVYSGRELKQLSDWCHDKGLLLYIDGARLGAALTCDQAGLTLQQVYNCADAFFIGGTKVGALLGEALVVRTEALKQDLRYMIKQRGALLAKGRVLGVQFEQLFQDGLYLQLAEHANRMAQLLKSGLSEAGCDFLIDSPTNQIFPIMKNTVITQLQQEFDFYIWNKLNAQHSAIRLVTSWATEKEQVYAFISACQAALKEHS